MPFAKLQNKNLLVFLSILTIVNLIQAKVTGLLFDESYYWYFAQNLSWGYFDHPPMVALLVKLGGLVFNGELGVRLLAPFLWSGTVFFIWKLIDHKDKDTLLPHFMLLIASAALFNAYGFFMLPDTPLIFFTVLFLYTYKLFYQRNTVFLALALGLLMACMMYSKYHAALAICAVLASNFSLWKKPNFWLAVGFALLLYVPHLVWLVQSDFAPFKYHLLYRMKTDFKISRVLEYIGGQFGVLGLLAPLYVVALAKLKPNGDFMVKTYKYIFYTFFFFFLISSYNRNTQPQWTIAAFAPLAILMFYYLAQNQNVHKWFLRLGIFTAILLVVARFVLVFPSLSPIAYETHGNEVWAKKLYSQIGDTPVVFENSYRESTMYSFYTGAQVFSANNLHYRMNQFDIDSSEYKIQGKKVAYVSSYKLKDSVFGFSMPYKNKVFRGYFINNFQSYRKLQCKVDEAVLKSALKPGGSFNIEVVNPYNYQINMEKLKFFAVLSDGQKKVYQQYQLIVQGSKTVIPAKGNLMVKAVLPETFSTHNAVTLRIAISENGIPVGFNGNAINLK